jgi:hypothetical protein
MQENYTASDYLHQGHVDPVACEGVQLKVWQRWLPFTHRLDIAFSSRLAIRR